METNFTRSMLLVVLVGMVLLWVYVPGGKAGERAVLLGSVGEVGHVMVVDSPNKEVVAPDFGNGLWLKQGNGGNLNWANGMGHGEGSVKFPQRKARVLSVAETMQAMGEIDGDKELVLPTEFRSGHVEDHGLSNYVSRTDDGYKLNLGSSTTVTTPVVVGGHLYTSGGFGTREFYCFDAVTGALRWGKHLDDDGPSPAIVVDSVVIFNTESCTIFCLDRYTGKQRWSKWLGDPLMSTPAADGKAVYTSYPALRSGGEKYAVKPMMPSHGFVALDIQNGKILWQRWLDGDVLVAPVLVGDVVYLTTVSGTLYKLDRKDGKLLGAVAMRATSAPTVRHGYVFVGQRSEVDSVAMESMVVLDAENLAQVRVLKSVKAPYLDARVQGRSQLQASYMMHDAGNGFGSGAPMAANVSQGLQNIGQNTVSGIQMFQPSTALVEDGRLYCLMGGTIYCMNLLTGGDVWRHDFEGDMEGKGGTLATSPILAGGYVVTVDGDGTVLLLDKMSGVVAKRYEVGGAVRTAPVAVGGRIYVPGTAGALHCVETGDGTVDGWGMLMGSAGHN